ncbi:hypothetical protein ACHAWU_008037, partial [Discostella pseudostelligera]
MVQRETEEGVVELTDMEEMCTEIQVVTERRFELAESAPVTNSSLRHSIGFLANTEFASRLVLGQEPIPPDIDGSTRLVIEEMQRLWSAEGSERFQAFHISSEDCRRFWSRVNEATSSSMSNLHFGIQKAAMFSDTITSFIADKISVIGSYGCPPTRWASGLQVMLEKIAGVALVNKLRAILLMDLALILFLGEMYVDDTDLIIMKPEYKSAEDVKADAQLSIDAWANLLISTGGALNPDKCYWYNVDYKCVDGEWVYSELVDWGLSIPLPDGNRKEIARANVDEAKKMLGIWS